MPTVSLTSSWVITASVNPPRASFVNFPLGHTAGRPNEPEEQRAIVRSALSLLDTATEPGVIVPQPVEWPGDWRSNARRLSDNRSERFATPQYERPGDLAAVEAS
jgi:hypothetical protein